MNLQSSDLISAAWSQFWQVSVVVLLVALLVRLGCRHRPHLAYALWMLVVVKCLTPPVWSSPTGLFSWAQFQAQPSTSGVGEETGIGYSQPTDGSLRSIGVERLAGPAGGGPETKGPAVALPEGSSSPAPARGVGAPGPQPRRASTFQGDTTGEVQRAHLVVGVVFGLAVGVWLLGVLASGGLVLAKWTGCRRLIRNSARPPGEDVERFADRLADRLGLRRKVPILVTSEPVGPLVFGVLCPQVVIPESVASGKSVEELEPFVAHELIHVRRRDPVFGLLQVLAQCVWWFHPLVWWANRQAYVERERCCDQEVVAGTRCRPAAYARSLLDVLEQKCAPRVVSLFPGVRPVEVTKRRLEEIMTHARPFVRRFSFSRWTLVTLAAVLVLPGAGLTVRSASERTGAEPESSSTGEAAGTGVKSDQVTGAVKAPPTRLPEEGGVTKRMVDAQGKPIAGAKVEFYKDQTPPAKRPFASTVTDRAGEFSCPEHASREVSLSFRLVVSAGGFRTGEWHGFYGVDGRRKGGGLPDVLRLDRPVTISGKVLGADGKPLAGVPLVVDYFNEQLTGHNARRIRSDRQGRFKIDDLPPAEIFIRYEKGQDETFQGAGDAQLFISHVRAKDGQQVENVMVDLSKATCVLEGRLVNYDGSGIAGASIKADFAASAARLTHYAWARTDQQGRYRIEGLPPHEFFVSAWAKNHYGGPRQRVKLELGETRTLRLLGYLAGHPAPEPKPDDPRWGKPAGDLRAAIELRPGREAYSMGETIEVRPVLRNTGEKTVTLVHDFAATVELHVTDEAGKVQTFSYKNFSGRTVATTYVLEPGHEVEMQGRFGLKLVRPDFAEYLIQAPGKPLAFALKTRPGAKYKLTCDLGNGLGTGETDLVVKE